MTFSDGFIDFTANTFTTEPESQDFQEVNNP